MLFIMSNQTGIRWSHFRMNDELNNGIIKLREYSHTAGMGRKGLFLSMDADIFVSRCFRRRSVLPSRRAGESRGLSTIVDAQARNRLSRAKSFVALMLEYKAECCDVPDSLYHHLYPRPSGSSAMVRSSNHPPNRLPFPDALTWCSRGSRPDRGVIDRRETKTSMKG